MAMKWWGWGDPQVEFPMHDKAELWPWIARTLGFEGEPPLTRPVARAEARLPPPIENTAFLGELRRFLKPGQLAQDDDQRLLHAYGKSYPDLFYARRGVVRRAPDLIVYPESHAEVEKIVAAAVRHNAVLIPFGGGTNIVGGVNPQRTQRLVATLDMARMNRLLCLDETSNCAVIEAGALGPKLERDLNARGWALGHYPDSFEFSTLGGWIATRSAGMQSDAYGKIEDMVIALKMVTPSGTLVTRPVPACSCGPDLNRLMAGSEGILGVITECTMRVHRLPPAKDYRGFLFRTFEDGVAAMRECLEAEHRPNLIRLQDPFETQLGMHMKTPKTGLMGFIHKQMKRLLLAKGYSYPALMIMGVEGTPAYVKKAGALNRRILKKHGGFDLGRGVGRTWSKDKYNLPYLRDWVMDRGVMVDVSETSTQWANVLNLYEKTVAAVKAKFTADGHEGRGFIGCHLSHSYRTGACLYFTYAARQLPGREMEQYYAYKKLLTETFLKNGATLTHHHAVGTEHRPWLEEELSKTGVQALRAVKESLDPANLMNPGKLLPEREPFANWEQPTPPLPAPAAALEPRGL